MMCSRNRQHQQQFFFGVRFLCRRCRRHRLFVRCCRDRRFFVPFFHPFLSVHNILLSMAHSLGGGLYALHSLAIF